MTTPEAAKYLGISKYYLRNMRHELHAHNGPPCTPVWTPRGPGWDYAKKDLDEWKCNHSFRKGNKKVDSDNTCDML